MCFVNYYQSKNHKQCYKIKKLLCKTIGKCQAKTPERALRIKVALSNFTEEMGMDNFGCLKSTCVISILLRICEKKIIAYVRLQMSLLLSPIRVSALLAGPPLPPPSVRTLWMTLFINFEIFFDSPKLTGTPNPLQPRPLIRTTHLPFINFCVSKTLNNTYENNSFNIQTLSYY